MSTTQNLGSSKNLKTKDLFLTQKIKLFFMLDFGYRTYKSMRIGECEGVPGNYTISKLKLCRNLTYAQAKNGFPSSLDHSLKSKWKIL